MKNNKSKRGVSKFLGRFFVVLSCVVICGGVFAFGDYLRQFIGSNSYGRERSSEVVREDTVSTITRRFMIGGVCGIILGLYLVARDFQNKKKEDDNP
jgi:hypothetical protein